ncbi:MFS transporter [Olleya sp. Hel_I_94]|uniref:MFS transporter n=1 Tax=Olleya sp. Hel_I_94 TaxID=1250001 RepID=UPI0011A552FD|nr:MFS transporter [Olleya sp. Hel_I_94]TVZ47258.1 putative MFS family arabinose efflux permease [Olleya sp. Hel_I_94]
MKRAKLILPIIVIAQFCCTSLWFAGNGVINDMVLNFNLKLNALGHLTSAVQFGFIIGTLVFAILTIADRFSPSKVFFISALFGATFNLAIIWNGHTLTSLLLLRFLTGFCLAGIYPIGMKIATDYFNTGLGKSLGFLVGALVLGTAFPHLLKDFTSSYPWKSVLITTSTLAVIGGLLILFLVPNGPYRKPSLHTTFKACFTIFKKHNFRHAAFGYFGHMWELYAFWVFTPIMLKQYSINHSIADLNIPLLSFLIIGLGGVACIISGYAAQRIGTKKTAFIALLLSCICCLLSPLLFTVTSTNIFVGFLMFWGMVVVADSPLLSTLIAESATPQLKGTSLTIVNCIGFTISIISIQLLTALIETTTSNGIYVILALGPILGLLALSGKKKPTISQ